MCLGYHAAVWLNLAENNQMTESPAWYGIISGMLLRVSANLCIMLSNAKSQRECAVGLHTASSSAECLMLLAI